MPNASPTTAAPSRPGRAIRRRHFAAGLGVAGVHLVLAAIAYLLTEPEGLFFDRAVLILGALTLDVLGVAMWMALGWRRLQERAFVGIAAVGVILAKSFRIAMTDRRFADVDFINEFTLYILVPLTVPVLLISAWLRWSTGGVWAWLPPAARRTATYRWQFTLGQGLVGTAIFAATLGLGQVFRYDRMLTFASFIVVVIVGAWSGLATASAKSRAAVYLAALLLGNAAILTPGLIEFWRWNEANIAIPSRGPFLLDAILDTAMAINVLFLFPLANFLVLRRCGWRWTKIASSGASHTPREMQELNATTNGAT